MAIVTVCQGCGQRLSVPDEYAGRTARCPQCKQVYTVPPAYDTLASAPPSAGPWRLRTEDGNVYGPVNKAELDHWVAEGRVTTRSHLLAEGQQAWVPASSIYPQLGAPAPANPFADRPVAPSANPYVSPTTFTLATRRFQQAHRGGAVLTLGIIGLLCCQLLAPVAWIMGQADLRQMNAGVMDVDGRTMTQVGMVLGIIGTVLLLLSVAFQVLVLFARAM